MRTSPLIGLAMILASPAAFAAWTLVDDFQGHTVGQGNLSGLTGGAWQGVENTSFAGVGSDSGNNYLTYGWVSGPRGAFSDSGITVADTSTSYWVYLQARTTDSTPDTSFGLTQKNSGITNATAFSDFAVQVRFNGTVANNFNLDVRNGAAFQTVSTGLTSNTWYDIWLNVNNSANTFDLYFGTTGDPNILGTLVAQNIGFRNTAAGDLESILAYGSGDTSSSQIDNIYINPVPEPVTPLLGGLGLLILLRRGRSTRP